MTLFFQQLGVWEAPAKVTLIGAAEDLSPGPEVGPPHPGCSRRPTARNASGGDGGPGSWAAGQALGPGVLAGPGGRARWRLEKLPGRQRLMLAEPRNRPRRGPR